MAKSTKPISHYDCLTDPTLTRMVRINPIEQNIHIKETSYDDNLGRVVSKLKKVDNCKRKLTKYRVSDFNLENLQITGAIDNLTRTFATRDKFGTLNRINYAAQNIVSSLNNE